MEKNDPIPLDIKRFILRSIDSVPHLEAILLLRFDTRIEWNAAMMAHNLYISEKRADEILVDLSTSGFASVKRGDTVTYRYNPVSLELEKIMDQLAGIYAKNLIEVTNLIHSKINKQAQNFGDAFKWQNEKD